MVIHDISRLLTPGHPNWPGDAPFTVTPAARIAQGDTVNTGVLSTSTHTGTHVDAPWHYADAGSKLDEVPLDVYIGPCLVLDVRGHSPVPPEVLDGLESVPERLLLYTGQPAHWATFPEDFAALSPAFVHRAARLGVRLIGTDAPSVDPLTSKTLDGHRAFWESGLYILEGLKLTDVTPGTYQLVCLPLPLAGVDGTPARAVLIEQ
ncbi:cyclase family protein [Deinococcus sp. KNUC1210]|uniref:cyclase family protein n=1 Tax=Deinococcus sp. KNUC1210 TaxID=2917691 RepID=UPI001EF073CB|nr:cyclase family protein [Deinococcus sp. KNUC1210]ULH15926.1 cyclase family protein [Deinococcus sp. KNUC1210]